MENLTSHNYCLEEIPKLRTYNSKTFRIPGMKEVNTFGPFGKITRYGGQLLTEFHAKPIHYLTPDRQWKDLGEVASYFGNIRGMVLKPGWEEKIHFGYLVWYMKRQKLLNGWGIRLEIPSRVPLLMNVVDTFFPDPAPETTSVDGFVGRGNAVNETFSTIRAGAGTNADSASATGRFYRLLGSATTDQYDILDRGIHLFDTSAIPDSNNINTAIFSINVDSKVNNLVLTAAHAAVAVVLSTPASNTDLVAGDYGQTGTVRQVDTDFPFADATAGSYADMTLNATGRSNVSKTGITKLATRCAVDLDAGTPAWASGASTHIVVVTAEAVGTGTDPKLAVTHTVPSGASGGGMLTLMGVG